MTPRPPLVFSRDNVLYFCIYDNICNCEKQVVLYSIAQSQNIILICCTFGRMWISQYVFRLYFALQEAFAVRLCSPFWTWCILYSYSKIQPLFSNFFNILFSVKNIYLKFYYFIKKNIYFKRHHKFLPFYEDVTVAANEGLQMHMFNIK